MTGPGASEIGAFINGLTEDASPDKANDLLLSYDASASAVKKVKMTNAGGGVARSGATTDGHLAIWNGSSADSIKDGGAIPGGAAADGWSADANTWSYSSADSPTFVISVNADMTGVIGVGDRIKLTQTSAKYFIVTAMGAWAAGATLITVYGGTDYTLANAAISSPYYSHVKSPLGFPMDPAKWTVAVTDTSARSQASPTQNTWYNIASISISIPIGCWYVGYSVNVGADRAAAGGTSASVTLSTANNTESDATMSGNVYAINVTYVAGQVTKSRVLTLAAKASYYLNTRTILASQTDLYNQNGYATLVVSAVCAYL